MLKNNGFTIVFLIWMGLITFLSLHSFKDNELPDLGIPNMDKLVHFVFYAMAAFLGCLFIRERTHGEKGLKPTLILIGILMIIYGMVIEMFQYGFTTSRDGNVFDVVANSIGTLAGILTIVFIFKGEARLKWKY